MPIGLFTNLIALVGLFTCALSTTSKYRLQTTHQSGCIINKEVIAMYANNIYT